MNDGVDDIDIITLEQARKLAGIKHNDTLKEWFTDAPAELNPVLQGGSNGVAYKISANKLKRFLDWRQSESARRAVAQSEHLKQIGLNLDVPADDGWAANLVASWTEDQQEAIFRSLLGGLSISEHNHLRAIWEKDDLSLQRRQALLRKDAVWSGVVSAFTSLRQDILGLESPISTRFNLPREDRLWIKTTLRTRLEVACMSVAKALHVENNDDLKGLFEGSDVTATYPPEGGT